jgi:hypothetical protein
MRFPHAHNNMVEMLQNHQKKVMEALKDERKKKLLYNIRNDPTTERH